VVSNGATIVQLREKTLSLSAFFKKALLVRKMIPEDLLFIVNDRVDIAVASGADGVHLGQDDLPISAARKVLGDHKIIGASTHSVEQAQQAEREGADYVAIGPVFSIQFIYIYGVNSTLKFLVLCFKALDLCIMIYFFVL